VKDNAYLSKGDVVTDLLREMITRGDLPPGMSLRQRDLAKLFNVSPTPVREALRRLESEGLVGSELHRGSHVAEINVEEHEENYLILAELEALATKLAVQKLTPEDLHEVEAAEQAFAQVAEDDPSAKELNREFHFRIYEAARSPLLLSLMRLLWSSFAHGPQLWRSHPESVEDHRRLVAALTAGAVDEAARITREHVLGSIGLMRTKLLGG
jgi:DNA-binding GntR family transcriptional regulator